MLQKRIRLRCCKKEGLLLQKKKKSSDTIKCIASASRVSLKMRRQQYEQDQIESRELSVHAKTTKRIER